MKKLLYKIIILSLILTLAIFTVGCNFISHTDSGETIPPTNSLYGAEDVKINTLDETERTPLSLPDAVEKVKYACVKVTVETYSGDILAARSVASGTIIDISLYDEDDNVINRANEYYILTCYHVIENTGKVIVELPDKNFRYGENEDYTFTGEFDDNLENKTKSQEVYLVGGDQISDIAVLKLVVPQSKIDRGVEVTTVKVPDMTTSNSYELRLGEEVFAISNPSGEMPGTVTDGIISYLDREVSFEGLGPMSCIQHNVSIIEGSSGGALFNMYGELVGVTNGGSTTHRWINYAIPMQSFFDLNNKKFVTKQEVLDGNLTCEDRGFISIVERLISTETAENYGYINGRWSLGITVKQEDTLNGVALVVQRVVKDSISEKAGIVSGDIIVSVTYDDTITQVEGTSSFSGVIAKLKSTLSSETRAMFSLGIKRGSIVQAYTVVLDPTIQHIFCDTNIQYVS